VAFSSLNDEQLAAAKQTLQAAMGTGTGVGYDQAMQMLMADDYLKSVKTDPQPPTLPGSFARVGYSSGNFFLAVLEEPSTRHREHAAQRMNPGRELARTHFKFTCAPVQCGDPGLPR
jgi:hypothetical protein